MTESITFVDRHIGPRPQEILDMVEALGYETVDQLMAAAVPAGIRLEDALSIGDGLSEVEVVERLRTIAERNTVNRSMIGMGYYDTITPAVILRNVLENPGWYTAYTPYQPEISQGRLEALINFQTMVSDLTGLPITNASLLDEATAAAEAMTMSRRITKVESNVFFVDSDCHPQTIALVQTRANPLGIEVVVGDPTGDLPEVFGLLLQYPGSSGAVRDDQALIDRIHEQGGLVTVAADPLALVLLRSPGEIGADIAVGSTHRFGVPMGFGGPHAGYMATGEKLTRTMPGRIVGASVDDEGRTSYRLALQTREQHIRREKATSNICTAQVLLAVMAGMYAVYHGPEGLRAIAERVHDSTARLAAGLEASDFQVVNAAWFDTLTVGAPGRAEALAARATEAGINLRLVDADTLGISLDETTTEQDLADLAVVFEISIPAGADSGIPSELARTSEILTHPVFHMYRSETDMMRYLRRLMDKDLALDRSMIPLGSCTMKLNAATEMLAVTWPEFAHLHPFVPRDQAEGYAQLIAELEEMLVDITGYAAVSLQPNSGAQGEYAGLLAIRGYHLSRGDHHRTVCLIPSSAHGTNPASATMAGMTVVVVECDAQGNVDVEDLKLKIKEHGENLAALMVTYPSTHGVFEEAITEICDLVHEAGGQVYLDGANLNAMVGVAKPGSFGSDVSHLNLHKTFTIPHGGGGPGVGPIGVAAHLVPFLPNHPVVPEAGPATGPGPIAAAPWGSAGILPISWAYIALMGSDGLRKATEAAIIGANYVAKRLDPHYPVLYRGANGLVAHECIIDLREISKASHVSVDDVAKRLMDYGFHAPTMSFPVIGTLMVEPTESESLQELDRFCDAMIAIRHEIEEVESGRMPYDQSPLHHAPHTAEELLVAEWDRPYSREEGAFPLPELRANKYWPPVGRIDGKYGDRHLVCSCPPLYEYR